MPRLEGIGTKSIVSKPSPSWAPTFIEDGRELSRTEQMLELELLLFFSCRSGERRTAAGRLSIPATHKLHQVGKS
jgi:hypothetical protein